MDRFANSGGIRVGWKTHTCSERLDTRSIIRLIADQRDAHERNAMGQGFHHRPQSALRDDRCRAREHRTVRYECLEHDIRWCRKPGGSERRAERDERPHRKRAERYEDRLHKRRLPLIERAEAHED